MNDSWLMPESSWLGPAQAPGPPTGVGGCGGEGIRNSETEASLNPKLGIRSWKSRNLEPVSGNFRSQFRIRAQFRIPVSDSTFQFRIPSIRSRILNFGFESRFRILRFGLEPSFGFLLSPVSDFFHHQFRIRAQFLILSFGFEP